MSNPFSLLSVSYGEDLSTENPQRKLAKMKRKYEQKPTPELKKKIEEMDKRLNYKPKPKRKKLNIGFKTILKEAQEEIETAENSLNGNLGVSK